MSVSLQFPPPALLPMESSTATLQIIDGTNVDEMVAAFDDTTEEYLNGKFTVPQNITSGNVTFRASVRAATGAASKNVALTFGHSYKSNGDDFDSAYSDEDSGDKAINATTENITVITWMQTVSTLGWAAGGLVHFRVSRPAASANNLSGDMFLMNFEIDFPTS